MGVTFSQDQLNALAVAMAGMGVAQKNDPASTTLTATTLHGPFHGNAAQYGIFSNPGVRPARWQTTARPDFRFLNALSVAPSVYTNERLEAMSGVTAASGTNAETWCDTPPTVGQGKICEIDFPWGNYKIKTKFHAIPQLGERVDYSDVPAQILNMGRANPGMFPFYPSTTWAFENSQLRYNQFLLGIATERSTERVVFQGNSTTAYTLTDTGWTDEFDGLDRLIKTGYTDAKSQVACPALDSAVLTFGADIGSVIGGGDGRNFVQAVSETYAGLKQRASAFGMPEAMWAIVMHPNMWRPAVDNWACDYSTYRCSSSTGGMPFVRMVEDTNNLRLELMRGNYLLIDNEQIPVYFSEGISRTNNASTYNFTSDMYIVPVMWNGIPLTRFEFFPLGNPEALEMVQASSITRRIINGGMMLWASADTPMCTEFEIAMRLRLILETPWLAGRIDDISYTDRTPVRAAQPGDTYNYANGGRTYR